MYSEKKKNEWKLSLFAAMIFLTRSVHGENKQVTDVSRCVSLNSKILKAALQNTQEKILQYMSCVKKKITLFIQN